MILYNLIFPKRSDTVNHQQLLGKVWNAVIRATLYRLLESYLVDRSQSVRTCGAESYTFQPTSGVPQGSNLGLFCIYINDFSLSLPRCKLLLYTYDAKLFLVIENSHQLQQEINNFLLWSRINGLSVHPSKCFFMSFSRGPVQFRTSYMNN